MKAFRYFTALGLSLGLCLTPAAEAVVISVKSLGMGGVGIGYAQDAMAAANNPAGASDIDDRFDVGLTYVHLNGRVTNYGSPVPPVNDSFNAYHSISDFVAPNFGANYNLNCDVSVGLVVYNRDLAKTTFGRPFILAGTSKPGLEYVDETISPYIAYRLGAHSFGVSFNWQIQRAKLNGFQNFDNPIFSQSPGNVTNKGYNYSNGIGYTFGWQFHVTDDITVGATYQPETQMSRFKKYKGFLANGGKFNIGEKIGAGISWRFLECATVAFDYEFVRWTKNRAVKNPLNLTVPPVGANQLGSRTGPGFGWRDKNYFRMGVDYAWSENLIVRAGYRYAKTQVRKSQATLNALTMEPLVESIVTAGGTWVLSCRNEIDFMGAYGFEKKLNGVGSIPNFGSVPFLGGSTKLKQKLWAVGISWGHKF